MYRTLESLHEDLKRSAEGKWHDRLLRKTAIEKMLIEYHTAVDDAARSFQVVTLIHIHRAVGDPRITKASSSSNKATSFPGFLEEPSSPPPPYGTSRSRATYTDAVAESPASSSFSTPSPRSESSFVTTSSASRSSVSSGYVLVSEPSASIASTHTSSGHSFQSFEAPVPYTSLVDSPAATEPLDDEEDFSTEEQAFLAELALFEDRGVRHFSVHTP